MKITTMTVNRPPRAENDPTIFPPMANATLAVPPAPTDCDGLIAALPPVFDPFSGSLVFSFLWAEKQFVDPTAKS